MLRKYICVFLVLAVIFVLVCYNKKIIAEHFNEQTGKFCYTCRGKTPNQCLGCFNCGFCVDEDGNSACIGGDMYGPFNREKCFYWYYNDPYGAMMQRNDDYKLSYGPRQDNRII